MIKNDFIRLFYFLYFFCSTLLHTRYAMLLITLLFGLTWSLGVTAAHFQKEEIIVAFMVAMFILAAAVLILRCLMDKQVCLFSTVL